jgi:flagella synthesis protein FlgN
MNNDQLVSTFAATVQASLHGLQTLEPILEQEHRALAGRNPGLLEIVVEQKIALLQQLQHSVQARDRLQQAAGFAVGNAGGEALVVALSNAELSADWSALLAVATRVATLNDRNGQLAALGQQTTRAAIGILTGRDQTEHTYSTLRRRRAAGGYSLAHA